MPLYPSVLKQYNVYTATQKLIGLADVQLPSPKWIEDSLKGAGISGELSLPVPGNLQAMEATFNFHANSQPALSLFTGQGQQVRCMSSILNMDTATGQFSELPEECILRMIDSGYDLGKRDSSTKAMVVITFKVFFLALFYNNVQYWGFDPLNGVTIVNGVNINAQTLANVA
jgi:P2 family phage contractile tail tube protein